MIAAWYKEDATYEKEERDDNQVEGELLSREEAHRVDNPDGKRERRMLRYSVEVKRKLSGWAVRVKLLSISTASDLPTEFNSVCARV